MDDPPVVSRDEWLAARKRLLAKEKEFTRQRDALNADRRRLPMTEIGKQYVFQGTAPPKGSLPGTTGGATSGFPTVSWESARTASSILAVTAPASGSM